MVRCLKYGFILINLFPLFISPIRAFCFAGELRLAARTLFDAGVAGLTNEETSSLVDRWQNSRKIWLSCYARRIRLTSRTVQCPFCFLTRKKGRPWLQKLCFFADLLPLTNTAYFPQGWRFLFSNGEGNSDKVFTPKRPECNIQVDYDIPSRG